MPKGQPYRIRYGIVAIGALFLLRLPVSAQQPARVDLSPFGVVGLAPGETLTLKATGASAGQGCKAQLGFDGTDGNSMGRSLNVNLAPSQSASTSYLAKNQPQVRTALRPVAWVEQSAVAVGQCVLAAYVKSQAPKETVREVPSNQNCGGPDCKGTSARDLNHLTLRLYAAATSRVCHAQMGFRQSNGRTSVTAKYVTLMPNHIASLDWRPDDDALPPTDFVIPEVAFHPGDGCLVSSELFEAEDEPTVGDVLVQGYESSLLQRAVDPGTAEETIQQLNHQLQTDPEDLWVVNALAQAYNRQGERSRAIKLLSIQVASSPRASESWLLLAKFQYEQAEYQSTVLSLEKCLALDPDNPTAKAAYADALAKVGRMEDARSRFAELLERDQTRTPAVLTAYAEFLYMDGRNAEALAPVEESDARHPNCIRTLWVQARVLEALKRFPEATQSAERAVQINSDFRAARLLLMKLYYAQGRRSEAAEQAAWLQDDSKNSKR